MMAARSDRFEINDDPREPVRLKPADSPAPPDPQSVGVELMALLRDLASDAIAIRDMLTRGQHDPVAVRRAHSRSIDLHEQAGRALDVGEDLMRACRHHGVYATSDLGIE